MFLSNRLSEGRSLESCRSNSFFRQNSALRPKNPTVLSRRSQLRVQAFQVEKKKWWTEHTARNVVHITGATELLEHMKSAEDKLVVVDFFATWCVACRAMFPELVKLANKYPDILILCVNYDENKELCKALEVKTIPFFHMYLKEGKVAAFSCGVSKLFILKDAIAKFRPLPKL